MSNAVTFDQPTMLLFPSPPDRRNSSVRAMGLLLRHFTSSVLYMSYTVQAKMLHFHPMHHERNQCFIQVYPSVIIINQSGQALLSNAFQRRLDLNSGDRKHKLALQAR